MHPGNVYGLLAVALSVKLTAAETIVIEAGDVYFSPAYVNASVGDILEFHFLPHNHSVVMGDLANPCQPATTGGFYSGFLPALEGENAQVFQVTINDTNPIVYYCSQNASNHNHCQDGMVGFVNQPDATIMTAYNTSASNSSVNISPDGDAFGGVLLANPSVNDTSNSTSGTTGTTTSTATASGTTSTSTETSKSGGSAIAASGLFAVLMALVMV